MFPKVAVAFVLLAAPAAFLGATAQPAVIVDTEEVRATVETVDQQKRMVLLRGPTGGLFTVHAGPEVRNLSQMKPGDRVMIRYTEALAARLVRPGEPRTESTTSMARANPGERPAGMIVDHDRERVTIEGINLASNTVAFIGSDRVPRNVTVQEPAMREFLRTLKAGDEVEVTFTEAVAVSVEPAAR
jgi:hypothetical protein